MCCSSSIVLTVQVKVYFQSMREPEQNLERSRSADDVVGDRFRRQDDFSHQLRSHTADRLYPAPQKSPLAHARTPIHNHSLEDRYHLLTPGVFPYEHPSRRDGMVIDTGSLGESMEKISVGGFSDVDPNEDDLSDTETDNEWEGCEVTHV